jgi:hypothetical protein
MRCGLTSSSLRPVRRHSHSCAQEATPFCSHSSPLHSTSPQCSLDCTTPLTWTSSTRHLIPDLPRCAFIWSASAAHYLLSGLVPLSPWHCSKCQPDSSLLPSVVVFVELSVQLVNIVFRGEVLHHVDKRVLPGRSFMYNSLLLPSWANNVVVN